MSDALNRERITWSSMVLMVLASAVYGDLLFAVKNRDVSRVIHNLELGCDPNFSYGHSIVLLNEALKSSQFDSNVALIISLLIAYGATTNRLDENGMGPLHTAVFANSSSSIKFLLDCGVDPKQADAQGNTAEEYAHNQGKFSVAEVLKRSIASSESFLSLDLD